MKNKTKNLIMKILEEEEQDLESRRIMIKLEVRGHNVTYDTISRNLKKMVNNGQLIRYAKGRKVNENMGKPWNYYYKIKETKRS